MERSESLWCVMTDKMMAMLMRTMVITMMMQAADIPPGVSLQRRNSAPEMSEPAQFVDHGSMEL